MQNDNASGPTASILLKKLVISGFWARFSYWKTFFQVLQGLVKRFKQEASTFRQFFLSLIDANQKSLK